MTDEDYGPIPVTLGDVLVPAQQIETLTARQIEIDNAVKAEREAIVKWLNKHGMRQVAMMIEEEEHLK